MDLLANLESQLEVKDHAEILLGKTRARQDICTKIEKIRR